MAGEFYTAEEVAEILKVSTPSVYNWIKEGKVEVVKIGRTVRITAQGLESLLSEHRIPARRPKAVALASSY